MLMTELALAVPLVSNMSISSVFSMLFWTVIVVLRHLCFLLDANFSAIFSDSFMVCYLGEIFALMPCTVWGRDIYVLETSSALGEAIDSYVSSLELEYCYDSLLFKRGALPPLPAAVTHFFVILDRFPGFICNLPWLSFERNPVINFSCPEVVVIAAWFLDLLLLCEKVEYWSRDFVIRPLFTGFTEERNLFWGLFTLASASSLFGILSKQLVNILDLSLRKLVSYFLYLCFLV